MTPPGTPGRQSMLGTAPDSILKVSTVSFSTTSSDHSGSDFQISSGSSTTRLLTQQSVNVSRRRYTPIICGYEGISGTKSVSPDKSLTFQGKTERPKDSNVIGRAWQAVLHWFTSLFAAVFRKSGTN